jgi:hypothetical protein
VASVRAQSVAQRSTLVRQLPSAECMTRAINVEAQSTPARSLRGAALPAAAADCLAAVKGLHYRTHKLP